MAKPPGEKRRTATRTTGLGSHHRRGPKRREQRERSTPCDLVVLSVTRAVSYEPSATREVCISITDPLTPPVNLSPKFVDVLRLSFSDITEPIPLPSYVLFSSEHANAILDFVDKWAHVDRIVVHCVGGFSRSPAVALAIAELRGWPYSALEQQSPLRNKWLREQLIEIGLSRRSRK